MVNQPNSSPSATRSRRYRERQHKGTQVIALEVSACDVASLIKYGLTEKGHVANRTEIAEGIQILLYALNHGAIEIDFSKLEGAS